MLDCKYKMDDEYSCCQRCAETKAEVTSRNNKRGLPFSCQSRIADQAGEEAEADPEDPEGAAATEAAEAEVGRVTERGVGAATTVQRGTGVSLEAGPTPASPGSQGKGLVEGLPRDGAPSFSQCHVRLFTRVDTAPTRVHGEDNDERRRLRAGAGCDEAK